MCPWLAWACTAPAHPLPRQDVYVWQRAWTAPVREGVAGAALRFDGLRVNAASVGAAGILLHDVDLTALATGQPVRLVVRIDADTSPPADVLADMLTGLADQWATAGVLLAGAELDHDCPTRALPAYAALVGDLRSALDVPLSITALPTWLSAPDAFAALAAAADQVVLQVHAVDPPAQGLFDRPRALAAVRSASRLAEHLWVALPAYGLALADGRELRVDPAAVAQTLAELPPVDGVVWFRLSVPGDARAWSMPALDAVRAGRPPVSRAVAVLQPLPNGAWAVQLSVDGPVWTERPARIEVSGRCLGDAHAGYTITPTPRGVAFVRTRELPLDPGADVPIGWVRCDDPPTLELR